MLLPVAADTLPGVRYGGVGRRRDGVAGQASNEASWKLRSLLRTGKFFTTRDVVMMFKAHILSYIEYRTPGIAHASTTTLRPIDRILARFLREIGMSENVALLYFGLAPLATRRDIAMLGVVHRAVLRRDAGAVTCPCQAVAYRARVCGVVAMCVAYISRTDP